jgi:hypothetical protein
MCGLGVGSYLGGRWADRRPGRLLTAYALLELAVGVLALGVALLLPQLGALYMETVGRRYREASFLEYRLPVGVGR